MADLSLGHQARITADQIMSWGPCDTYDKARIEELFGNGRTPRQVLALDIPEPDRCWVLLNLLSAREQIMCGVAAAEAALMSAGVTDSRCWDAIREVRVHTFADVDNEIPLCAAKDEADDAWEQASFPSSVMPEPLAMEAVCQACDFHMDDMAPYYAIVAAADAGVSWDVLFGQIMHYVEDPEEWVLWRDW